MIRNERHANFELVARAEKRFVGDLGPKRSPKWTPPRKSLLRRIADRLCK